MTRSRLVPIALFLLGCGGGGGEPSAPLLVITKGAPSGDAQSGVVTTVLPVPLAVKITQDGAPVAGQSVTFTPGGGAGTVLPSPVLTGSDGIASASWTLGQSSGARFVTVTSPGVTGGPIQFGATALAAAPAQVVAAGGQGQVQEAGASFPRLLTALVLDAFGNGVPGVTVAWSVAGGSGTVGASTSVTGASGGAVMGVVAGGTPGSLAVIAVPAVLPSDTVHFGLSVTPTATVVTVNSNFFQSDSIGIPIGGAVRWIWNSGTHNVTEVAGPATFPGSATQSAGATYGPLVFNVAGTYTYECTLHAGMIAKITVQ